MGHLSTKVEQRLKWRRDKVREYAIKGLTQRGIASILQIPLSDVNRDLKYLRQQAKQNIQHYVDEYLPAEYENCLEGLNSILIESWKTAAHADTQSDTRGKLQALTLAKECYSMKLDLLSSATVVQKAVEFIDKHRRSTTEAAHNNNGKAGTFDWLDENGDWHYSIRAYLDSNNEWHFFNNGDLIWPQPKYENGVLKQPQRKQESTEVEAELEEIPPPTYNSSADPELEELEELEEIPEAQESAAEETQ